MPGDANTVGLSADDIPPLIRQVVRQELRGHRFGAEIAYVEAVDHDRQRATIALKRTPDVQASNVPIATTYASDGAGDIMGLTKGDEGLLLHSQEPLDRVTAHRGRTPGRQDTEPDDDPAPTGGEGALDGAIFFPAMLYYADDDVPVHEDGERLIAHDSGSLIRMRPDGNVGVEHEMGVRFELGGESFPDDAIGAVEREYAEDDYGETLDGDLAGADGEHPQSRPEQYVDAQRRTASTDHPNPVQGHATIEHPIGVTVTVTEQGVSIEKASSETGYGRGGYGGANVPYGGDDTLGGSGQPMYGAPTDPWRVELAGHQSHRHLVPLEDGTVRMTGGPLAERELFDWLLNPDSYDLVQNRLADDIQQARAYYQAYFAWLDAQTTTSMDPALPEHGRKFNSVGDWPKPEPQPPPGKKLDFDPTK